MNGILIRLILNVAGLAIADALLSGMSMDEMTTFLVAAILLGFVNAFIRPLAILFTLPATVFSLGLFLWVINGAMLYLVAWLLEGFHLASFGTAMVGSLVIGLTSWIGSLYVGGSGNIEIITNVPRR